MEFKTLIVRDEGHALFVTLNRPQQQNSINTLLLEELNLVLDTAEKNHTCRLVILKGNPDTFCSGMDLREIALLDNTILMHSWASLFMKTLKRFTTSSKVIVAHVEGKAIGGGVGLAAACDWVLGTDRAHFKLTEAYWGLLPAMIAPYITRRIGPHKACNIALTSRGVRVAEAKQMGLVDEETNDLDGATELLLERLSRSSAKTSGLLKTYFQKIWIITEAMEELAINETLNRLQDPEVRASIRNFVEHGRLPWEGSE